MNADEQSREFHRAADAEIDLIERIEHWCNGANLNHTDINIANRIEKEFGIPADKVLREFKSYDAPDRTTAELVMRAAGITLS